MGLTGKHRVAKQRQWASGTTSFLRDAMPPLIYPILHSASLTNKGEKSLADEQKIQSG